MRILAINPGSTSTKIAVYEDTAPILVRNIRHSVAELARFAAVIDQFDFRKELVLKELEANNVPFAFDAIIGRGGLFRPIPAGVYEVNDAMRRDARHAVRLHACNLGCLIAAELAALLPGCRAFIADPGVVDEMSELVHITGSPHMPRITIWHALNQRAIARRFAAEQSAEHPEHPVRYEDLRLIICHLGGGISTAAHLHGRSIDVNNALDGEGPFSPERTGNLPMGDLVDLCYSGKYTSEEVKKQIYGKGGLIAHLGTNDMLEIERRIANGDSHAELVLNAMIYQVAKSIAALSVALCGKIDAILLTGGIAHSHYVIPRLKEHIAFLAPVYVYPGEDELEALAMNARGALTGEMEIREYR
ncbi:MAG: butyrate kinase [Prevotellaceae bacterium]|jgi:butyrate kinase|nr:butyrate kinase [Prevotellaceae bacterium]